MRYKKYFILTPIPDIIITIMGMIFLALCILFFSVLYWIMTNLVAILVGIGSFVFFVVFIGQVYSYRNDIKSIKQNFNNDEADCLVASLRKKTLLNGFKLLIFLLFYIALWSLMIFFLNKWLL